MIHALKLLFIPTISIFLGLASVLFDILQKSKKYKKRTTEVRLERLIKELNTKVASDYKVGNENYDLYIHDASGINEDLEEEITSETKYSNSGPIKIKDFNLS